MGPCEKITGAVNMTLRMSIDATAVTYRQKLMAHLFSSRSGILIIFPQVHDDTLRSPRSNWLPNNQHLNQSIKNRTYLDSYLGRDFLLLSDCTVFVWFSANA